MPNRIEAARYPRERATKSPGDHPASGTRKAARAAEPTKAAL
jgi:hypothetical protein